MAHAIFESEHQKLDSILEKLDQIDKRLDAIVAEQKNIRSAIATALSRTYNILSKSDGLTALARRPDSPI